MPGLRAYAALLALLLLLLGLRLRLRLRVGRARDRRPGAGSRLVEARHPVAPRLLAEEAAEVGGPPRQRGAVGRVPVVVVAVVEVLALEVVAAVRRAGLEAHRVLERVAA